MSISSTDGEDLPPCKKRKTIEEHKKLDLKRCYDDLSERCPSPDCSPACKKRKLNTSQETIEEYKKLDLNRCSDDLSERYPSPSPKRARGSRACPSECSHRSSSTRRSSMNGSQTPTGEYALVSTQPKRSFEDMVDWVCHPLLLGSKSKALAKLGLLLKAMKKELEDWSDRLDTSRWRGDNNLWKALSDELVAAFEAVYYAELVVNDEDVEKELIVAQIRLLCSQRYFLKKHTFRRLEFWCDDPLACLNRA